LPSPSASFADRVIVIIGASDGIGAELARRVAPDGAKLVPGVVDRMARAALRDPPR
jgi:NAD(P)-dependent dehydrogenase (short-subunit alcohol dehydrogenase family)